MIRNAFKLSIHYTFPLWAGMIFMAIAYTVMMHSLGFPSWYPPFMAAFIFAGSMEYVTVDLLQGSYDLLNAFLLGFIINCRHLFYGISILEPYSHQGWKKPFLIYMLTDEAFAINSLVKPGDDVDRPWFMLFVSAWIFIVWVGGTLIGNVLYPFITFDLTGISFIMPALFITMFFDQLRQKRARKPALIGLGITAAWLLILGPSYFIIPSLVTFIVVFAILRHFEEARHD